MPELPEVETVRQTLRPLLIGQTVTKVDVRWPKIIQGDRLEFEAGLTGATFTEINRYGKYLFFIFGDLVMVSHLRMEGKFYYQTPEIPIDKHVHVIFTLSNGMELRYHDVRKFGTMELTSQTQLWELRSLKKLGYEPFSVEATPTYLFAKFQRTTRAIKAVLLDQHVIVGLGNIYVDEVLFRAKIYPETPANQLSQLQASEILAASIAVLNKAIALGGTTIRTYQSIFGVDGRFQNELAVHTKAGEACVTCGTPIEKMKVGGRGTYYCPTCQKRGGK
ncbi:MAG: DNA-formamidopyrimidine glycosylase [Culicoidibacterales bacterium]